MGRIRLNVHLRMGKPVTGTLSKDNTNRLNVKNFASTIVRNVGLSYAEDRYREFKQSVEREIQRDVEREIQHTARRYVALTVDIGNQRASQGRLTTSVGGGPTAPLPNRPWAPLSPKYQAWKTNHGFSPNHFKLYGNMGRVMRKGSTWTGMFGPVRVQIVRTGASGSARTTPTIRDTNNAFRDTFSVGRIQVTALGEITAAMIPALATGNIGFSGSSSALMGLVHRYSPPMAYKLGGDPYRATLEPFLGFLLMRAIPHAVFNRVRARISGASHDTGHTAKRFR